MLNLIKFLSINFFLLISASSYISFFDLLNFYLSQRLEFDPRAVHMGFMTQNGNGADFHKDV